MKTVHVAFVVAELVLLFTSLLAIPLACQRCFYTLLLTGLQVVGVTLDFLDDVFLLNLTLEPAQCIFERLAFLYTNLCQVYPPPNLPCGSYKNTALAFLRPTRSLSGIAILAAAIER